MDIGGVDRGSADRGIMDRGGRAEEMRRGDKGDKQAVKEMDP